MLQPGQEYPHFVKGVEYFSLTKCLKDFRRMVERETGVPLERLDVNAAMFLDDVAKHIGLSAEKRSEVLGKSASDFLGGLQNEKVKPS